MKNTLLALFALIFLASCSPSQQAIQTAIAQTATAQPTNTPTPRPTIIPHTATPFITKTVTPTVIPSPTIFVGKTLPLKEELAFGAQYLPTGYSYGQYRDLVPAMFDGIITPANQGYQQFSYKNDVAGGLSVFIYQDKASADQAFEFIYQKLGNTATRDNQNGGQLGVVEIYMADGTPAWDWVIERCTEVSHARFTGLDDDQSMVTYLVNTLLPINAVVCH